LPYFQIFALSASAFSQKVIGHGGRVWLTSWHIVARFGPLEVPINATLISKYRWHAVLMGGLRRPSPILSRFPLLILLLTVALAQSPFDTGFTARQALFTGTVAKVASAPKTRSPGISGASCVDRGF